MFTLKLKPLQLPRQLSRCLSTSPVPRSHVPALMSFPNIVSPRLSHTLRNWFLARTLITPYFDKEFSQRDFDIGAHQAAVMVAHSLAVGDLNSLDSLVTSDALKEIRINLSAFSPEERSLLTVSEEDIYFSFAYQIGIIMEDHPTIENASTRHVEIMWVGHSFPNYVDIVAKHKNPLEVKKHMDARGGPMVLNYRFIKDFTSDVEDTWRINALNHFFINNPNYDYD